MVLAAEEAGGRVGESARLIFAVLGKVFRHRMAGDVREGDAHACGACDRAHNFDGARLRERHVAHACIVCRNHPVLFDDRATLHLQNGAILNVNTTAKQLTLVLAHLHRHHKEPVVRGKVDAAAFRAGRICGDFGGVVQDEPRLGRVS